MSAMLSGSPDSRRRVGGNMSGNGQSGRRCCVSSCMSPVEPPLAPDACYLALKARDARFDGSFFTGVTSTGIYCRPVCRVRTPRRENCRFFAHAAQAEGAGFALPALPARAGAAGAALVAAGCQRRAGPAGGPPARRAGGWARGPLGGSAGAAAGHQRPPPAPHLRRSWACRRCSTCRRAAAEAKQLLADTPADHAGGAGQRLRQRAPLQRGLHGALRAEPGAAARGPRREAARKCGWLPAALRRAGDAGLLPTRAIEAWSRSARTRWRARSPRRQRAAPRRLAQLQFDEAQCRCCCA